MYTWAGKAVSVNKWTNSRVIKKGGKLIPLVYKTTVYKKFVDSLAETFSACTSFEHYVDIELRISLWKMRDSDSIIKPVLDAMEQAEIVTNDRFVRNITIKRTYHHRDGIDEITLCVFPVTTDDDFELQPSLAGYGNRDIITDYTK